MNRECTIRPKVSVVLPSLNVVQYIRECIESVINQSLKEIEIICVDAGSTDGTLEIIKEYAESDKRIKIINSPKKSYGYQMNLGMDAANGEYMGIVETDDIADSNMFETLYNTAVANSLDVVKSGFYLFYTKPETVNIPVPITSHVFSQRIFCPSTDFLSPMEQVEFFNIKPTIWSAIYKLSFLRTENIRFNETKGASYQDCSFNFKVWALAMRVKLIEDCFLHYRQDNENSSVNSTGKVFCIADEYAEIEDFLKSHPLKKGKLSGIKTRLKYDSYMWNYNRLNPTLQKEFIEYASKDFAKDMALGECEKKYFPWYKWNTLLWIINSPEEFHKYKQAELAGVTYKELSQPKESLDNKIKRIYKKVRVYIRVFGWKVTFQKAIKKISRVIRDGR